MTPRLSQAPLVHHSAEVESSSLGRYTEIAERCRISETILGDYSYMMQDCAVWCADIGRFSNIAASVRIKRDRPSILAQNYHVQSRSMTLNH